MDFEKRLHELLPLAQAWAERQEKWILETGSGLPKHLLEMAQQVGVNVPESIRVLNVKSMPPLEPPELRLFAERIGFLGPSAVGLTIGYSVMIMEGHYSVRLLSHEFRHVHQYESLGGLSGFLPAYARQVIEYGCQEAPLEVDARSHEILTLR